MALIGKIFGIGIVVVVFDMILAQAGRKDMAFGVTLVGIVTVLGIVILEISHLFTAVTTLFGF